MLFRSEPGVYPGNRDTDYGRSGLRGPGSGLYPGGYDEGGPISDRVMSSPRVPDRFADEGEAGSRLNPISDPQDLMDIDLLHTRVNGDRHRNGVIGGYTPAPPVDRYHPLWNVNGGPGSESALAGRLSGAGMLGAGAMGVGRAARMGGGLHSSVASALSRGGTAGMSALRGYLLRPRLRDLQAPVGREWHCRRCWCSGFPRCLRDRGGWSWKGRRPGRRLHGRRSRCRCRQR